MFFFADCLLTFTVSRESVDRTSELSTMVHLMLTSGLPDALHVKFKLFPSLIVIASGKTETHGASGRQLL